jgi:hypothetical protein
VPFLLAERAHSESARSMRAVKGNLGRSTRERCRELAGARATRALRKASLDTRSERPY